MTAKFVLRNLILKIQHAEIRFEVVRYDNSYPVVLDTKLWLSG